MSRELAAAALGAATGGRTFAAPSALAQAGVAFASPLRFIVWGAALGELVADKQPEMAARTAPRGLTMRALSAAASGYVAGGRRGSAIALAVALPVAFAASAARDRGLNAYVEDGLTYALAAAGAHAVRG